MIALVDIGNTRIKWTVLADGSLGPSLSAAHPGRLDAAVQALLEGLPHDLERALIANVAGSELGQRVAAALRERFGLEAELVVTRAEALGLRCGYTDPTRLGVDRWLGLIAARASAAGAVCVIQAGTAVTFDAVDASGRHLGGLIFAGPRLSAAALERNTGQIGATPLAVEPAEGLALLGRSTEAAVGNAAWLALSSALDRAVAIVAAAAGAAPTVLLTGGDAALLAPWLETQVQIGADLVLKGLALLAELEGRGDA